MNPSIEPETYPDTSNRIFVRIASQISLVVNGEDIFRELQERVLKWAFDPSRNLKGIPDGAWDGESFEIDAEHSERAAAIKLDDPTYWAFLLRERLKDTNRIWTTEVGIAQRRPDEAVFGCRLICSQLGLTETVPRSIPNFVRGIAFTQNALLDGRPTSAEPWIVDKEDAVDQLVSFLNDPGRNHPLVVFALPEDSSDLDETVLPVKPFIRRTAGYVHTAIITSEASYELTNKLGREFSVYRQAIRTYNPGFDPDSDLSTAHPVASAARVHSWDDTEFDTFTDFLVHQTLRLTRPRDALERVQPPFQQVKRIAAEHARTRAYAAGESDAELLRLAEEEAGAAKQEAQASLELAVNADVEKEQALAELRQIKASYMVVQARLDALQNRLNNGGAKEKDIPDDLADLESWANQHLAGSVELHSRALRGAKDSQYEDVSLIYKALLLLRDFYVPMRRQGGTDLKEAFEARCRELSLEEQPTFTGERAGEQGETYFVRIGQKRIMLDRHLKKGVSREPRYCFRLYFFWDDSTSQVVVGWLPSHLSTRAS
ncbi:MAG: hypothetical protein ABJN75_22875 [Hoeflea sp.]|uniref:hypothetical protein n=1 Tax=Hoeflea sp. TaxID=1940281 RepID=UPI0032978F27